MWIGAGTGSLLAVAVFVFGARWLTAEREWTPYSDVEGQLTERVRVSDYTLSLPADYKVMTTHFEQRTTGEWAWKSDGLRVGIIVLEDESFRGRTRPEIRLGGLCDIEHGPAGENVMSFTRATVDDGLINGLPFVRIRARAEDQKPRIGPPGTFGATLATRTILYVAHSGNRRIDFYAVLEREAEGRQREVESVIRTLRPITPDEEGVILPPKI